MHFTKIENTQMDAKSRNIKNIFLKQATNERDI